MTSIPALRRRLLAVGAIAAPALAAIGAALTTDSGDDGASSVAAIHANATGTLVGTLLMTVGAACFLSILGAFAALTPRRGGLLTTIGLVIGGFGAAVFAGALLSYTLVQFSLPPSAAVRATDELDASALGSLPWNAVFLVIGGAVLSTAGLLVAGAVRARVGVLLIVGVLLTVFAGNFGTVSELLWLPFTIGVALAVRPLLTGPHASPVDAARPVPAPAALG